MESYQDKNIVLQQIMEHNKMTGITTCHGRAKLKIGQSSAVL